MKAFFDIHGDLAVEAEAMTELFAPIKWYESYTACETALNLRWKELASSHPFATLVMGDARQVSVKLMGA